MKTLKEYLEANNFYIDEDSAWALTELTLRWKLEKLKKDEPFAKITITNIENVLDDL
jgi:hypothetical protein